MLQLCSAAAITSEFGPTYLEGWLMVAMLVAGDTEGLSLHSRLSPVPSGPPASKVGLLEQE
jgi:hypothetical protein